MRVQIGGRMGMINTDNKMIVAIIYNNIEKLRFSNDFIEVPNAYSKSGLYDTNANQQTIKV